MNCQLARNRILAVEEPDDLPEELAAHIERCADCKAWHQNFVSIDRALASLPVASSDGLAKIAVLEQVRATPAPVSPKSSPPSLAPVAEKPARRPAGSSANHKPIASTPKPLVLVEPPKPLNLDEDLPKKKRPSFGHLAAKFWPAGLVAATLLIGTIAWLSLRGDKQPVTNNLPPDPMLDNLVKLNVELAKTQTPAERVEVLAKVADELSQEMRDIARADPKGDEMQALLDMYRKVIVNGLVAQAEQMKSLEPDVREKALKGVVDRLAKAGQKAEQMAAESPEHSADRLRQAAALAREGTKSISRVILKGASS
jgi:hypothetical protein